MHDDLLDVAARRARGWLVLWGGLAAIGPGIVVAVLTGPIAGLLSGVGAAVAIVGWVLAGAPGLPRAPWPRAGVVPAGPEVTGIAAGVALATGSPEARAWEVAHPAPNVAGFVDGGSDVLLVTDGARSLLGRDQLEAVCAAQLAIGHDRTCRWLAGAVVAIRLARALGFVALVTLGFTLLVPFVGLLLVMAIAPGCVAAWLVGGRVRWWERVAADAVCVRTTRHPEALVAALRTLARASGEQVHVGFLTRVTGAGGSQWAIELGPKWTSQVTVNQRAVDRRTSNMVEDTRLLLRAALVRGVCLEGFEPSVASYRDLADAVRRAGRAAAAGGAAEVDGELIGLDGVVLDDGAAPPGWHPDPLGRARLRWWDGAAWTDRTS